MILENKLFYNQLQFCYHPKTCYNKRAIIIKENQNNDEHAINDETSTKIAKTNGKRAS